MLDSRPTRLHKVVTRILKENGISDYTQPEIQRNIANYGVKVDSTLVFNRLEWIYPGQNINIDTWPVRAKGNLAEVRVLEETTDYLLIFKPTDLAVQPGTGHQSDNLVTWLIEHYPEQQNLLYQSTFTQQDKTFRNTQKNIINPTAGLVHRIDKDAQGLLLVARSLKTLDFFQDQFRNHQSVKKYLTVVHGQMSSSVRIQNWQTREAGDPTRQKLFWTEVEALKYNPKARNSESAFQPLAYSSELNLTLVEATIKTGRMHQIRLQAESLGYPLVGDKVYNRQLDAPKKFLFQESDNSPLQLLPTLPIRSLPADEFNALRKQIFGDAEFCLLSNYLSLNAPKGKLEKQLSNVSELI